MSRCCPPSWQASIQHMTLAIFSQLSVDAHVTTLCRSGYYQLQQLRPVTWSRSTAATETVVHAFIVNRLDYCNSLLYGVADGLMRRLQSVQNVATWLVTGARRCEHITPNLRQLHWLPMRQRVLYKIAVLVFQCLASQAPSYLALVSDVRPRRLRSSDAVMWVARRTRNTYGDRCFAAAGPLVWNSLLAELRQCDSLEQFKRRLKTHFFRMWKTALCDCSWAAPCRNTLTYSLTSNLHHL